MNNALSNPVTWSGAVTALAVAIVPFLRAFNIYDMTKEQVDAFLGLLAAIILVATLFLHSAVITKGKAQGKIDDAWQAPSETSESLKPKA